MDTIQTMSAPETGEQGSSPSWKSPKLLAFLLIALLILGGAFYILRERKTRQEAKNDLDARLRALEALNKDTVPLTEAEVKARTTALETLNKNEKPLTLQETQDRLKALEALSKNQ